MWKPTSEFIDQIVRRLDRIDRKSLEQHLQNLLDEKKFLLKLLAQAPYGIIILTLKREIVYFNRRIQHLFNLPEEFQTKAELDQSITDQNFVEWVTNAIQTKKEKFNEEIDIMAPRPMLLHGTLLFEDDGASSMVIIFISNLTEKEKGVREKFKIEHVESTVRLAAGIAHEIGNPLNSITIHLGLISKMVEELPNKERKKIATSLGAITDETKRLDRITRNFLKAVRQKPVVFELHQMNDLIKKALVLLAPELQKGGIGVIRELDLKLPAFLLDGERIHQVFVNLIKNAMQAMPNGGTLKIKSKLKEKLCCVTVQDTGLGIPEEKIQKIFDAYYTTKEEGSGLGLLIVSQVIRDHGGRIEIASKVSSGTTVTFILPIRKEKLSLPSPANKGQS